MNIGLYCWADLDAADPAPFLATVGRFAGKVQRLYCFASKHVEWPAAQFIKHVRPLLDACIQADIEPWIWCPATRMPARPETLTSRRDRLAIIGRNAKWPLDKCPWYGEEATGTGVGTPGKVPSECPSHPEVRDFLIERLALVVNSLPFAGVMLEEPSTYTVVADAWSHTEASDAYCWCPRCKPYHGDNWYTAARWQYLSDVSTPIIAGIRQLVSKPIAVNGSYGANPDRASGRDWSRWCKEDLIDAYSPQCYDVTADAFKAKVTATSDYLLKQATAGHVESMRPILACHYGTPDAELRGQVAYCKTMGLDLDLFHSGVTDKQLNIILEASA